MSITLLDGGMGQELQARSDAQPTGLWSTQFLLDAPELVRAVHDDFFAAGAGIATAATYSIHHDRLQPFGLDGLFADLHRQACRIAVEARDAHGSGLVAGSLGPTGWSYRPDLAPAPEVAASLYADIARLHAPYVDMIICETMASVDQARGALMGALAADRPVWLSLSVDDADGTRLRSGEALTEILTLADEMRPAALLINCSVPEAVSSAVPLLCGHGFPVGAYANGFTGIPEDFARPGATVDRLQKRMDLDPTIYADFVDGWIRDGATIVGGCCEVGPAHIAEIARRLRVAAPPVAR